MRKASVGNKDAQQAALIGLVTSYGFAEKDFEDEIEAFELSLDDLIDHDQNSKVLDLSSQKYRDLKKDELRGMHKI